MVGQVAVGLPGGLDLGILHGLLVRLHGIRQGGDLRLYRRHLIQNLTQLCNPSQRIVNFLLLRIGGIGHIQTLEGRFHIVQGGTVGFANCVFQNAVQATGQVGKGLHVHGDGGLVAAPVAHREGIGTAVVWQLQLDRILISAIRNHSDCAIRHIPVRHTVVMNLHLLGHIVGFPVLHAGEGGRIAFLDQLAGTGVARIIRLVQRLGVEVVHPVLGDRHLALIRRPRP